MKKWTGERLETFIDAETTLEHLHRYAIAKDLVANKTVLDIACGEGYGASILADAALSVTGVDISKEVINSAKDKYRRSNLSFITGSAARIPCESHQFDVVVSFETIEHHDKHDEMLREIKRVLKPNGLLIISSPDKLHYSEEKNFSNAYHVKELYENEFKEIIKIHFDNSKFYYQRPTYASVLIGDTNEGFIEYEGNYNEINTRQKFCQLYIVGIASDGSLPSIPLSIFSDDNFLHRQVSTNNRKVKNTLTYRLGNVLLFPLKLLRKNLNRFF